MSLSRTILTGAAVLGCCAAAVGRTFTVSKDGRGAYTTVQAAVNAAGKGDIVKILDNAVYQEQVSIDSTRAGLLLTSENPQSPVKPTIKWQDKVHVKPTTCQEAHTESTINFDQNGALRLMRTRNVTVDGIAVDGGGVYPFGANGIWDEGGVQCKWPLQHGNAAVAVWISGDITIRNCDVFNAYIGINVKDRNEGGIFANANPADLEKWRVVPMSGFAKTGNHLVEANRIHDNSWGMFFESTWDLGSVVRYNLFYKNHHPTDAVGQQVKTLTSEGANQPGGAMWFKDHMLSPLAIYNNTFWSNFLIFSGHWRAGSQHLIFNNIYAKPHRYWGSDPNFQNPFHKLDQAFVHRMKHCVYAAQTEAPKFQIMEVQEYDQTWQRMVKDTALTWQVRIMNDFGEVEQVSMTWPLQMSSGTIMKTLPAMRVEGNRIIATAGKPFPVEANIRWLETRFKSTDPASPDFLTPDWSDSLVQKYIVDQGWPEAGIRDADGSIADLGAIPSGGRPQVTGLLKPLSPVMITGTQATIRFDLTVREGQINSPRIKYFRFINNIAFQANAFGGNVLPIPLADILEITPPATPITIGANSITVPVPARGANDLYAFFEMVIEGTGPKGEAVTTTVGFMPYRKLDYTLKVSVYDLAGTTRLSQVRAGDTVRLKIEAYSKDNTRFMNTIKPAEVSLNSGADLLGPDFNPITIPNGFESGSLNRPVVFTKVPEGGLEYVMASGLYEDPANTNSLAFFGTSDAIRILPGPPHAIAFQDPPSKSVAGTNPPIIDPGQLYDVKLQVSDRFGNKIDRATSVSIASGQPTIGDIDGPASGQTDSTGAVAFKAKVTNGEMNQIFTLTATLAANGATDQADLKVGKARDRLWILFADTAGFDPSVTLNGEAGEQRYPVVIRASTDGTAPQTDRTTSVRVTPTSGIEIYESPTSADPAQTFALRGGQITIWIRGTGVVHNGALTVAPVSDNTILPGNRSGIFFTKSQSQIEKVVVYANNGLGRVDSVDILYFKELKARPDSISLMWPSADSSKRKVIVYGIALDPVNKRHVTIKLPDPFPADLTTYSGSDLLGTHFWYDPTTPDIPVETIHFRVKDGVGPLVATAMLVERLAPGNDTLYITFTEAITMAGLEGQSLLLEKANGTKVALTVFNAEATIQGIRVVVRDEGANAPAAGDKVRINPTGPLTDIYGNTPHPENRPVVLSLKPIPASVRSSWYLDVNADGTVDQVIISFNKTVLVEGLRCTFQWTGNAGTGELGPGHIARFGNDSTRVVVDLGNAFTTSIAGITSGEMSLSLTQLGVEGIQRHAVADSAAPVLVKATFAPGWSEDQTPPPDTFIVVFTEPVLSRHGLQPYLLANGLTGDGYTLELDSLSWLGNKYSYLVRSISGGAVYPNDKDSVWINPSALITDAQTNAQTNAGNRRVLLEVKPLPYRLTLKVTDNPFVPGVTSLPDKVRNLPGVESPLGVAVIIDPNVKLLNQVSVTGSGTVYDAVGNLIAESAHLVVDERVNERYFVWSGRNRQGRYVGTGTYLAILRLTDESGRQTLNRVKIGVVR